MHTSTGFSPLHSAAVNYGTFRISLCLLYTHDHLSWTAALFHEAVEKLLPRPSNHAILLTGILRALWDHDASDHPSPLCIHLPDQTLLRSLRSPPTTYSNEVTEWLQELAQLQASPLISYDHVSPPKEFSPSLASAPLGMYFAQVYAVTGISPSQLSFDASAVSPFSEVALTSHSLSHCLPVGLLRDTWTWRDIFTGTPLLVPFEPRIQASRLLISTLAGRQPNSPSCATHLGRYYPPICCQSAQPRVTSPRNPQPLRKTSS